MENNFSIFDLERRKWELSRERDGLSVSGAGAAPEESPRAKAPVEAQEPLADMFEDLVLAGYGALESVRDNKTPETRPVLAAVRKVVDGGYVDQLYEYASLHIDDGGLAEASAFMALACMKIGLGLGMNSKKTLYVGVAAMLCDLGRIRLPERLHGAKEDLSPQDRAKVRTLPHLNAQLVGKMGPQFAWLAEVVVQIGERIDGSGQPNGIAGKQISELASILGLVAHIMSKRLVNQYANPFLQSGAIRVVVNTEKKQFPRRVLKEFLDQISLFPVGTLVRLNNESIGRVLATYKSQPMRPTMELLYDGLGKRKDKPKIIHLSNFPLLHIVEAVVEGELAADGAAVQASARDEASGEESEL